MLGFIFVFMSQDRRIKAEVAEAIIAPALDLLDSSVAFADSRIVHVPHDGGVKTVLLANTGEASGISRSDISTQPQTLPSIGKGLLELYERSLGEIGELELAYLLEWLPRVMVDELQLAETAKMTLQNDKVEVVLRNPAFKIPNCGTERSHEVGCAICNSLGDAFAMSSKRSVLRDKCIWESSKTLRILFSFAKGRIRGTSPGSDKF